MYSSGIIPFDDNSKPVLALWDDVNGKVVPIRAGSTVTGADGKSYALFNSVGSALAPYASNPTQTAAAGADTQYKFGSLGTTSFNHVSGQNNTAANVYLAFDQSTTVSGNQVYVIAPGQAFSFDRNGTILHFSSPAQQSFGGTSGITVEAFA